ncbi:type-F conjugative transfer system protein TraW [Thiobacillus denitrificans]|uniref:type-F conjugative transfer system protein TraW n=1 Tax=Thiobacillus denitrificans TaxID=36861 RepID=UPI0012FC577D|nr:type-F conjugative transfer system protein TraW [Thiobacillus denitrificans]
MSLKNRWSEVRYPCSKLLVLLLLAPACAFATYLGQISTIYPIQEEDAIEVMQAHLRKMEKTGELARIQKEQQKRAVETFNNPHPVEGITRTSEPASHWYDPTVTVVEDIIDPTSGRVVVPKGTVSNPFDYITLTSHYFFFDGRDKDQVNFAAKVIKKYGDGVKLILVGGSPTKLGAKWKRPVYASQDRHMIDKFQIEHVPAIAYQEGKRIRIDELVP